MKRLLCLICLLCLLPLCAVQGDPLGFGFVNANKVALRKEPGGKRLHRLDRDTCVWISDSRTDREGTLWYKINAGVHENHTNYDFSGWMMAQYIVAGDDLWHDVASVSANRLGMIALRTDGTVETAGRPIVSKDGSAWVSVRGWADGYRDVRQVGVLPFLDYFLLTRDGRYVRAVNANPSLSTTALRLVSGDIPFPALTYDSRLVYGDGGGLTITWLHPQHEPDAAALAHVVQIDGNQSLFLLRTDDGRLFAARFASASYPDTLSDWESWTGLTGISTETCLAAGSMQYECALYAGVRQDGTVLAAPEKLAALVSGWDDMADVQLAPTYVLGLRRDGTVLSASVNGDFAPDVSAWRDITAIAAADDYCVGVRSDGTLVFAGEHIFMREGHS